MRPSAQRSRSATADSASIALVVPLTRSLRVGVGLPAVLPGMTSVIVWHLLFGLGAGLVGWGVSRGLLARGSRPDAELS